MARGHEVGGGGGGGGGRGGGGGGRRPLLATSSFSAPRPASPLSPLIMNTDKDLLYLTATRSKVCLPVARVVAHPPARTPPSPANRCLRRKRTHPTKTCPLTSSASLAAPRKREASLAGCLSGAAGTGTELVAAACVSRRVRWRKQVLHDVNVVQSLSMECAQRARNAQ